MAQKFKRGAKVVPVRKSLWGHLSSSNEWHDAKIKNAARPFLYINGTTEEEGDFAYVCGAEKCNNGDFFRESDLVAYNQYYSIPKTATAPKPTPTVHIPDYTVVCTEVNGTARHFIVKYLKTLGVKVPAVVEAIDPSFPYLALRNRSIDAVAIPRYASGETYYVDRLEDFVKMFEGSFDPKPKTKHVRLTREYTAIVSKDNIKVGCQTIERAYFEALIEAAKEVGFIK